MLSQHCRTILQPCKYVSQQCEIDFLCRNTSRIITKPIFSTATTFCNDARQNCIKKRQRILDQDALPLLLVVPFICPGNVHKR
jgi:hypothetical protein